MSGITAFGKPVASGLVSQIMESPSLTQSPSPATPETVPNNELALKYAQLLAIATDLMAIETDNIRKMTLAENVQFYDRAIKEAIKTARSGGAPAPITLPMGGPPQAPGPAPGPPAAMGAPTPGAPPSPPPPGVGGIMPQGVPSA